MSLLGFRTVIIIYNKHEGKKFHEKNLKIKKKLKKLYVKKLDWGIFK